MEESSAPAGEIIHKTVIQGTPTVSERSDHEAYWILISEGGNRYERRVTSEFYLCLFLLRDTSIRRGGGGGNRYFQKLGTGYIGTFSIPVTDKRYWKYSPFLHRSAARAASRSGQRRSLATTALLRRTVSIDRRAARRGSWFAGASSPGCAASSSAHIGYYAVVRRQQCSPIVLARPEPRPQPYRTSLGRIGSPGEGSSGRPKSIVQLMEWLQEELRRVPMDVLQTLVESMPDRVAAVIAARKNFNTMSVFTRQKAKSKLRNCIRLERASQKQPSDTHETPYIRVKRCREQEINIKAFERVNVDVFTQNKWPCPQHRQTQFVLITPTVRLLASHQGEPGSIRGRITPGFSQVRIVLGDDAGRRVFSGISCFPRPGIPELLHSHLASPSSVLNTSLLRAARISQLTVKVRGFTIYGCVARMLQTTGLQLYGTKVVEDSSPVYGMTLLIRSASYFNSMVTGENIQKTHKMILCPTKVLFLGYSSVSSVPASSRPQGNQGMIDSGETWLASHTLPPAGDADKCRGAYRRSLLAECGNWDIAEEDGRRRKIARRRRARCSWCEWTRGRETRRVSMEQHWNERLRKREIPENSPTKRHRPARLPHAEIRERPRRKLCGDPEANNDGEKKSFKVLNNLRATSTGAATAPPVNVFPPRKRAVYNTRRSSFGQCNMQDAEKNSDRSPERGGAMVDLTRIPEDLGSNLDLDILISSFFPRWKQWKRFSYRTQPHSEAVLAVNCASSVGPAVAAGNCAARVKREYRASLCTFTAKIEVITPPHQPGGGRIEVITPQPGGGRIEVITPSLGREDRGDHPSPQPRGGRIEVITPPPGGGWIERTVMTCGEASERSWVLLFRDWAGDTSEQSRVTTVTSFAMQLVNRHVIPSEENRRAFLRCGHRKWHAMIGLPVAVAARELSTISLGTANQDEECEKHVVNYPCRRRLMYNNVKAVVMCSAAVLAQDPLRGSADSHRGPKSEFDPGAAKCYVVAKLSPVKYSGT
ncbi:hypothetical protein PR048_016419 [Dryococelus australis]|uniref:Uncharacterized protein n=1 Tax=Dryococelus australis TaxID=614101 RepID=A0ABQ9HJN3_9NEOP|nr:hypothetical protein PR048_016419 [Dryococelus australis]